MHTSRELTALRGIAAFEALKGVLALAGAIAVLSLMHKDLADMAEHLLTHLHLDPESNFGQSFIRAAYHTGGAKVALLAFGIFVYAGVRFTEAYGLWHARAWAEWFALLSGAMYLPLEIVELLRHANTIKWGVFLINILIVLYMGWLRSRHARAMRRLHRHRPSEEVSE